MQKEGLKTMRKSNLKQPEKMGRGRNLGRTLPDVWKSGFLKRVYVIWTTEERVYQFRNDFRPVSRQDEGAGVGKEPQGNVLNGLEKNNNKGGGIKYGGPRGNRKSPGGTRNPLKRLVMRNSLK